MIISTTESINGHMPKKTLGFVKGSTVRARWFGRDIAAGLKTMVGGEIKSYTTMLDKAREEAIERMIEDSDLRASLKLKGLQRPPLFSYAESAQRVLTIYQSLQ